jgi:hypothetical protein
VLLEEEVIGSDDEEEVKVERVKVFWSGRGSPWMDVAFRPTGSSNLQFLATVPIFLPLAAFHASSLPLARLTCSSLMHFAFASHTWFLPSPLASAPPRLRYPARLQGRLPVRCWPQSSRRLQTSLRRDLVEG